MQSDNINELATALSKAQGEMDGAAKDSTNPHFKSKYADLASVLDACRKPLSNHGLAVVQLPRSFDGNMRLVTMLAHSSGQWIEDDGFPLMLDKQNMQGVGSATTYARRYGLMAMVGIAPEDDDGNSVSGGKATPVKGAARPTAEDAEKLKRQKAAEFAQKAIDTFKAAKAMADVDAFVNNNGALMRALEKYPELNDMVAGQRADTLASFEKETPNE